MTQPACPRGKLKCRRIDADLVSAQLLEKKWR
jgi:hypothetical protein